MQLHTLRHTLKGFLLSVTRDIAAFGRRALGFQGAPGAITDRRLVDPVALVTAASALATDLPGTGTDLVRRRR